MYIFLLTQKTNKTVDNFNQDCNKRIFFTFQTLVVFLAIIVATLAIPRPFPAQMGAPRPAAPAPPAMASESLKTDETVYVYPYAYTYPYYYGYGAAPVVYYG